jgi:hypothetical protein
MAKQDKGQPRDPVELRKKLKFRGGVASTLTAAPAGTAPKACPAEGAAGAEVAPVGQTEQIPPTATSGIGFATTAKSADAIDLSGCAADPLHNGLVPNAGSEAAEPRRVEPRGPDYAACRTVIAGLARQNEQYRRQWRERHDKDPATPLPLASQRTQELYKERGLSLLTQYVRTMAPGAPHGSVDPRDFVNWLLASKPLWDHSTWRFYRAGAHAAIRTIPSEYIQEALAELYSNIPTAAQERPRDDDATPDRRANRMDRVHFDKLKFALGMLHSNAARQLEIWLDASIHTGLHPAQWPLSSLETQPDATAPLGRRVWLHVVIGHVQVGWLAHRTIDISSFSTAILEAVRQMIENARDWACEGQFSARQGELARILRDNSEQQFRRMQLRYGLHSLREQFIENMRSIYNDAEVAALVGQLCLNKERKNYSKRRAAWTAIDEKPLPPTPAVKRMQRRLEIYEQLRELKELKENWKNTKAE